MIEAGNRLSARPPTMCAISGVCGMKITRSFPRTRGDLECLGKQVGLGRR
jgi:hypothetical protein